MIAGGLQSWAEAATQPAMKQMDSAKGKIDFLSKVILRKDRRFDEHSSRPDDVCPVDSKTSLEHADGQENPQEPLHEIVTLTEPIPPSKLDLFSGFGLLTVPDSVVSFSFSDAD